jgi:hypothetical protein
VAFLHHIGFAMEIEHPHRFVIATVKIQTD